MTILSDNTIKKLCKPPYRDFRLETYVKECVRKKASGVLNKESDQMFDIDSPHRPPLGEGVDVVHDIRIDKEYEINNDGESMITPFIDHLVRENDNGEKVISYGLTSYGYDVRLDANEEVKVFTNANGGIIDPMSPDEKCFTAAEIFTNAKGLKYFILPPNSYALACTVERFSIPRNVSVICLGKSTYARSCAIINVTPIEAGFKGNVVIEISNGSTLPIMIYLETGIAQFQFFHGDKPCDISYADGNRKYQGQRGVTLSRI